MLVEMARKFLGICLRTKELNPRFYRGFSQYREGTIISRSKHGNTVVGGEYAATSHTLRRQIGGAYGELITWTYADEALHLHSGIF